MAKILVVDDEPNIVMVLEARLKANGYEVISAEDGQAGLEKAQKEKPDLIILDVMLPKLEGYKVCGFLKRDMRYSRIPIIMFTAKAQEEDIQMGKDMGADAYLVKPFKPEVLLAKIQELLAPLPPP
jgi:DNA-binding response OmpR family regulator